MLKKEEEHGRKEQTIKKIVNRNSYVRNKDHFWRQTIYLKPQKSVNRGVYQICNPNYDDSFRNARKLPIGTLIQKGEEKI
ncbi:MAG: hypothetical protein KDK72_04480 [Chlamydiia bacterium]|nr:hypothetical protein [Chlamydiia bacterium]